MTDALDHGDAGLGLRVPVRGVQLVEASAGTGKTFALATLYLRLVIVEGLPVRRVLAVTFTEAATKELRAQLRARLVAARDRLEAIGAAALDDAAQGCASVAGGRMPDATDATATDEQRLCDGLLRAAHAGFEEGTDPRAAVRTRLRRAVADLDLAPIHTIHAFCQRALHEHALAAGQPLAPRELLANETPLRREVAVAFWRRQATDAVAAADLAALWTSPSALADSLRELLALDGLGDPPEVVDAGGIEAALQAARAALALAFDAHGDAAREGLRRACERGDVNKALVRDSTVDPLWAAVRAWRQGEPLADDPPEKFGKYGSAGLRAKTNQKGTTPESALFEAIDAWVVAREAAASARRARCIALVHAAVAFAREELAARKRARGQVGYDDLVREVHDALAGPHGTDLARALQRQYAVALVDEFQDTDPRQWTIFRRLFAEANADAATGALFVDTDDAAPRALFLIGDPKQAIYRFRGGDVATYLEARSHADAPHVLARNHRSRPAALRAVQALFELRGAGAFAVPGIEFVPVQPAGRLGDDGLRIDGEAAPGLVVQPLAVTKKDPLEDVRALATQACVAAIADLLAAGLEGRALLRDRDGVQRAVRPGDLAVLVPRNDDALAMQRALAAAGIASVAAGRRSVYASEEAQHVAWLLEALLAPADEGRLRAVLASPLFGLDAATLAALDVDAGLHRAWQDRLQRWVVRARRHGPTALLADVCAAQAPRLLRWPDGERRLANYLHLAEELADTASAGLVGALDVLGRRIEDADKENDAELLRLEGDAARVRIMTLHVSKGLTLDLVYLPFAATHDTTSRKRTPPTAVVHDRLERIGVLFPEKDGRECKEEELATRAEHVRLLYVGLTRARLQTWVAWGASKCAARTALGWLLHRTPDGGVERIEDATAVRTRLDELQAAAAEAIAIEPLFDATLAPVRVSMPVDAPPPARTARRAFDDPWSVVSFSQLAREVGAAEAAGNEARGADDELELFAAETRRFQGPRFGNALHAALENIDFAAWRDWHEPLPPPHQLAPLEHALRATGYATVADLEDGVPLLTALVAATLNAPLPEGARLCDVPVQARVAEMEFHLAFAPVQVDALLATLHAHGIVPGRDAFGARARLAGLLTGRIDLVYEFEGRYFVADWKSNRLPAYDADTLARAVRDSEYDLQYVLYSLALHRWLRFRLGAAYDPARHFGGVRYLFCRGLDPDDATRPGVHAPTLPVALLDELDARLRPEPA